VTRSLDGRVAVCTGAELDLGRGLALALADAGASVALLGDTDRLASVVVEAEARDARSVAIATDFAAAESFDAAFGVAVDELDGPVDVLLHAFVPEIAYEAVPFETVDDERWDAVWEGTMRATLFLLQAGHRQMSGRGGRIVLVTPTIALAGAPGLVPYTAAVEGQRLLAKSAARQWGADGITVNCIAPAPEHVPVGVASMALSIAAPALGGPGDPERDVGRVAVFLAGDDAHFVTGATICADGGIWMAP